MNKTTIKDKHVTTSSEYSKPNKKSKIGSSYISFDKDFMYSNFSQEK